MATQQDAHKELFLDMLTKEEREALLTKKMESLRKQNEAIRKRYEEVEADKRRAEVKLGSNLPAQKELHAVSRAPPQTEDHDPRKNKQMQQLQQQQLQLQQLQQNSRPATRSKPPASHGGGGRGLRERPKSQDFRSEAAYEYEPIVDIADLDYRQVKRAPSPSKAGRRNAPRENVPVVSNNMHTSSQDQAPDISSTYYRPRQARSHGSHDLHDDRLRNNNARGGQSRGGRGGRVYTQTYVSGKQTQGKAPSEHGPPPDPAYNYLSDHMRDSPNANSRQVDKGGNQEGGGGGRGGKDPRRHPRNFGGPDFNNVKSQMKAVKEKERDRRSFPPRNRLEMSVNMTGVERFQYEEWKAERQKVDQERLDRQKTSSGEWRRAWDQEKHYKEYDEPLSPGRTEPARRPVGRIGSGRFDRGDRDDRRADGLSQSPKAPSMMQSAAPPENERKPPAGRGRGRGRGRARAQQPGSAGGPGEKPPRPRTWSGGDDSRTVECSNDMLVVKIDKSKSSDDHSVEVEYGTDNDTEKKKSVPAKKKPGRRSPTKQKQQQQQQQPSQFQDAEVSQVKGAPSPPVLMSVSSQDSSNYEGRPASLSQSLSVGSTDEWEDMTGTDSDLYATTTEDEGESYRRAAGRLNPDAPVFQPTSPELVVSPPGRSGFDLAPKQQRNSRSPASSKLSSSSTRSQNSVASSVGGEPTSPSPKPVEPTTPSGGEIVTTNGKQVEEEETEEATPEREILDSAHEDLHGQDYEEGENNCLDSEDKVDMVEEQEIAESPTAGPEEVGTSEQEKGESEKIFSLADELSAAGHPRDNDKNSESPQGGTVSSLADELCAAGAKVLSNSPQAQTCVQDHFTSQDVDEIEEDEVEEDTVPVVSDNTVPQGETPPATATASEETEEKPASGDADSSCPAAPEDSADSPPKPSGTQMATCEEDGGSLGRAEEPSSSLLTSSGSEAVQESETNVMEKPLVSGDAAEAAAAAEDSAALETLSTTSRSA